MGIKLDEATKTFVVSYSKRHPTTHQAVSLRRIGIPTATKAKRVYDELVARVNEKIKRAVTPLWPDLLTEYFANISKTDLRKGTIYNREKTLRYHTLPMWQEKFVDAIKTEEIYNILQDRMGKNAEAHKKFLIKCIRGVMQYALEKNYVARNPTPLLKFKANEKIKSVLNEDQIRILLRRAQELEWEWYPHYAVGLYTGMRNGELYALTWDKVNLEQRQILVNVSWSSKDGYKSTKSGDDRIVEIPKPLLPVLAELKLHSGASDFVLPRLTKWDKGEQARFLRIFLKTIGLPEIRFHDLRASWATLLLGKGVIPSKVMSMGGWRDMDTMMIYMRKAGISIKGATSVLDDMQTHGVSTGQVIKLDAD